MQSKLCLNWKGTQESAHTFDNGWPIPLGWP